MIQTPKIEAILCKAIFKNISCHINLHDANKFAIIIRIGKHQSKYTQKILINSFDLTFQTVLQVQVQQKDLQKTHRSEKCECMLYKFKEYQGKQNRQLIGMASMGLSSIKNQQSKKRIRLTNSIDRQAYIQLSFYIQHNQIGVQRNNQSRVSSAQYQSDIKSVKSIQLVFPDKTSMNYGNYGNYVTQSYTNKKLQEQNINIGMQQMYYSRSKTNPNNQFYNNTFSGSPVHYQALKQERSVDLISSLQDQIDLLNNKLQNSQKQLVQIKKSKAQISQQSKKSLQINKKTEELQIQNTILRQKLQKLERNMNLKKNSIISQTDQKIATLNKNYFSQGYQKQDNQNNYQNNQKNKLLQKFTFQAQTSDQNLKKQDFRQQNNLGLTFQQNSSKNMLQVSSPYFKNYQKTIKTSNNQCEQVLQFVYFPLPKQQRKVNQSVSQIQKYNYQGYHKFEGKNKGSKHKIIGYVKNNSNNNSFLSGSNHESVISQSNTNHQYKTVNFNIPNSDQESNQSIINIASPVEQQEIRCSIDPRNDQHKVTLDHYNNQTEQFRKREKALRKTNQKLLIQNRRLKRQKEELIQESRLNITRSQNAQSQYLKVLQHDNKKLQEEIQNKEQKINILTKKYQLYLTENNRLKNQMKNHLKTMKQYRLALYSKDQENKQEQGKFAKTNQEISTSSKNSIKKYQKKIFPRNFDNQPALSQHTHKKSDSNKSQKEAIYSSHVVLNNIISKADQMDIEAPRQLKKSSSSKGIAQMKMRLPMPNTPNIPKPPSTTYTTKGFDQFVKQEQYIKNRKNTAPLSSKGSIIKK